MDLIKAIQTLRPIADALLALDASQKQIKNVEQDYIAAAKKTEAKRVEHNELTQEHEAMKVDLAKGKAALEEAKRKAVSTLEEAKSRAESMVANAVEQAKFKADAEYQTHQDDIARVEKISQEKQSALNVLLSTIEATKKEHATILGALSNLKSKIGAV